MVLSDATIVVCDATPLPGGTASQTAKRSPCAAAALWLSEGSCAIETSEHHGHHTVRHSALEMAQWAAGTECSRYPLSHRRRVAESRCGASHKNDEALSSSVAETRIRRSAFELGGRARGGGARETLESSSLCGTEPAMPRTIFSKGAKNTKNTCFMITSSKFSLWASS